MIDKIFLKENELTKYLKGNTLVERTKALLAFQMENWDLLRAGYESLKDIEVKTFEFDGFEIKVQFNPGRIISSSAKVDEKSINSRGCFLCHENLPDEQRGLPYYRNYLILCNPYPIFPEHFTLSKFDHIPQNIIWNFEGLLNLSKDLGKYFTIFYNGPKCGASAPDHMHFQAGTKNFMPVENEYNRIKLRYGRKIFKDGNTAIYLMDKYLRKMISLESKDPAQLIKLFDLVYSFLEKILGGKDEPMMNIISSYDESGWRIIIFPRFKHRPTFFFEKGDKGLLLSPAAVDLGGVCITPQKSDFDKIKKEDIVEIFRQVSIPGEYFDYFDIILRKSVKNIT